MEEESHPGSHSICAGQSNRVSWTLNGLHFIQLPACWGWACTLCAVLLLASAYGLGHIRLLPAGFFKRIVDAEARRLLPRRELLKRLEVLANDCLCRYQEERAIGRPLVVKNGCVVVRALQRVASHVEYLGRSQPAKTVPPDTQTHSTLLQEMNLTFIN